MSINKGSLYSCTFWMLIIFHKAKKSFLFLFNENAKKDENNKKNTVFRR